MPSFCAVLNCSDKYGHQDNISFHKFPIKRSDLLQKKWLEFANRGADWQPSKWSAVCSRHFREEDFNCVNERKTLKKSAIPSVQLTEQQHAKEQTEQASSTVPTAKELQADEKQEDGGIESSIAIAISSPSMPKVNCRLCGNASAAVVTFSTNFEIYGFIQKCFPTLSIQQDDNLPKDICRYCLKRLEGFSRFIDKVLETQSELQRKFRSEKPSNRPLLGNERQLKIKQEPVVRVKQEVAEGFESFLSDDLDACVDDSFEHEKEQAAPEQKYDFCDFPLLNTQDIINNCDIMEIINLDDPFINIPDDDANTTCENNESAAEEQQLQTKTHLPSAHELLQAHMLTEEHNYACAAEDFKEEFQIKNIYKTEKTDDYESEAFEEGGNAAEHEDDYQHYATEENMPTTPAVADKNNHVDNAASCSRSTKPIVTSVSAIAESRIPSRESTNSVSGTSATDTLMVARTEATTCSQSNTAAPTSKPHTKPNIVVLNESIVKSSTAFQLQTCSMCHLKFFSVESLNQHYIVAHNQVPSNHAASSNQMLSNHNHQMLQNGSQLYQQQMQQHQYTMPTHQMPSSGMPMVSVPSGNIWERASDSRPAANIEHFKVEKGCESLNDEPQPGCEGGQFYTLTNSCAETPFSNAYEVSYAQQKPPEFASNGNKIPHKHVVKNKIKILEMQQTFLRHQNFATDWHINRDNHAPLAYQNSAPSSNAQNPLPTQRSLPQANLVQFENTAADEAVLFKLPTQTKTHKDPIKTIEKLDRLQTWSQLQVKRSKRHAFAENMSENYRRLRKRYRQLQRKCRNLQEHARSQQARSASNTKRQVAQGQRAKRTLICRHCKRRFRTIHKLLYHKQTQPLHHTRKPRSPFAATCAGCEKFFRSKLALHNHMRYICQSLPLCYLKTQMQTFTCRHCRQIKFNHWRLYRRHELTCRHKMLKRKLLAARKRRKEAAQRRLTNEEAAKKTASDIKPEGKQLQAAGKLYSCTICAKVFANSNSLNQHSITHTEQRTHKCGLCGRVFKRRNGLTQHMKGFHLQLKPYECPVCKHCYALKCDMKRCKHSLMRAMQA